MSRELVKEPMLTERFLFDAADVERHKRLEEKVAKTVLLREKVQTEIKKTIQFSIEGEVTSAKDKEFSNHPIIHEDSKKIETKFESNDWFLNGFEQENIVKYDTKNNCPENSDPNKNNKTNKNLLSDPDSRYSNLLSDPDSRYSNLLSDPDSRYSNLETSNGQKIYKPDTPRYLEETIYSSESSRREERIDAAEEDAENWVIDFTGHSFNRPRPNMSVQKATKNTANSIFENLQIPPNPVERKSSDFISLTEHYTQIDFLNRQLQSKEDLIENLLKSLEDETSMIRKYAKDLEMIKNENQAFIYLIENLEKDANENINLLAEKEKEITSLREVLRSEQDVKRLLNKKYDELNKIYLLEKDEQSQHIEVLNTKIGQLKKELRTLKKPGIIDRSEDKPTKEFAEKDTNANLQIEMGNLTKQPFTCSPMNVQVQPENTFLEKQLSELTKQRDDLLANVFELITENDHLKSNIDKLKSETQQMLEKHREETARMKIEYETSLEYVVTRTEENRHGQQRGENNVEMIKKTVNGDVDDTTHVVSSLESEIRLAETQPGHCDPKEKNEKEDDAMRLNCHNALCGEEENTKKLHMGADVFQKIQESVMSKKDGEMFNVNSTLMKHKNSNEDKKTDSMVKDDDLRMLKNSRITNRFHSDQRLSTSLKNLICNIDNLKCGLDNTLNLPNESLSIKNNQFSTCNLLNHSNGQEIKRTFANDRENIENTEKLEYLTKMLSSEQEQNCVLNEKLHEALTLYDSTYEQLEHVKMGCKNLKLENNDLRRNLENMIRNYVGILKERDCKNVSQITSREVKRTSYSTPNQCSLDSKKHMRDNSTQIFFKSQQNDFDPEREKSSLETSKISMFSLTNKPSKVAVKTDATMPPMNDSSINNDKISKIKTENCFSCHEYEELINKFEETESVADYCRKSEVLLKKSYNVIKKIDNAYSKDIKHNKPVVKNKNKRTETNAKETAGPDFVLFYEVLLTTVLLLNVLIVAIIASKEQSLLFFVFACSLCGCTGLAYYIRQRYREKVEEAQRNIKAARNKDCENSLRYTSEDFSKMFSIIESQEVVIQDQQLKLDTLQVTMSQAGLKVRKQNPFASKSTSEQSTLRKVKVDNDEIYTPRGENLLKGIILSDFIKRNIKQNVSFALLAITTTFILLIGFLSDSTSCCVMNIILCGVYSYVNKDYHLTSPLRIKKDSFITAVTTSSIVVSLIPLQKYKSLADILRSTAFAIGSFLTGYLVTLNFKLVNLKEKQLNYISIDNTKLKRNLQEVQSQLDYKTHLLRLKDSYEKLNKTPIFRREDLDSIEMLVNELDQERKEKSMIMEEKRMVHQDIIKSLDLNKKLTNHVTISIGEIKFMKDINSQLRRELLEEQINVITLKDELKMLRQFQDQCEERKDVHFGHNDKNQNLRKQSNERSDNDYILDDRSISFASLQPHVGTDNDDDVDEMNDFCSSTETPNKARNVMSDPVSNPIVGTDNTEITAFTSSFRRPCSEEITAKNKLKHAAEFDKPGLHRASSNTVLIDGYRQNTPYSNENEKLSKSDSQKLLRSALRQLSFDSGRGSLEVSQNLSNNVIEDGEKLKQTELENSILEKEFQDILAKVLNDQKMVCNEIIDLTDYIEKDRQEKLLLNKQVKDLRDQILTIQKYKEGNQEQNKDNNNITTINNANLDDAEREHLLLEREFEETLFNVLKDQKTVCTEIMDLTDYYEKDYEEKLLLSLQVGELQSMLYHNEKIKNEIKERKLKDSSFPENTTNYCDKDCDSTTTVGSDDGIRETHILNEYTTNRNENSIVNNTHIICTCKLGKTRESMSDSHNASAEIDMPGRIPDDQIVTVNEPMISENITVDEPMISENITLNGARRGNFTLDKDTREYAKTELIDAKSMIQGIIKGYEIDLKQKLSLTKQARRLRERVSDVTKPCLKATPITDATNTSIRFPEPCGLCDHYAVLVLCYRENMSELEYRIANEKRKQKNMITDYEKEIGILENVLVKKYAEIDMLVKEIEVCFQTHNDEQFQIIKQKVKTCKLNQI